MLTVWGARSHTDCAGTTRRDFLQAGGLAATGLMLPDLLRARAEAAVHGQPAPSTSVVWLWLGGGPSHVETFDPKMTAPAEFRSTVGAIQTNVPGIEIGSVFPRLARVADKMAFVRSFAHRNSGHGGGAHWVMTGYDFPPADDGQPQNKPGFGSILARHRGPTSATTGLPTYVRLPSLGAPPGIPGDGPAWLGAAHAPFDAGGNAFQNMTPQVSLDRLTERRSLLNAFDTLDRNIDRSGTMASLDSFETQAFQLLHGRARAVFDLNREDQRTFDLYGGRTNLGQQLLLARRLCEAGIGFVTIHFNGWDMHARVAQEMRQLGPRLDQAVAGFIQDTHDRGLDRHILLVITGEFGRTPRINTGAGRDHWAPLSTLALVGGGLRMGQVIGESDARAEVPRTRPITPQDLMATVFHVLGVPRDLHYQDPSGRPVPMVETGRAIPELV